MLFTIYLGIATSALYSFEVMLGHSDEWITWLLQWLTLIFLGYFIIREYVFKVYKLVSLSLTNKTKEKKRKEKQDPNNVVETGGKAESDKGQMWEVLKEIGLVYRRLLFGNFWKILNFSSYTSMSIGMCLRIANGKETFESRSILAIASIASWGQTLYYLRPFEISGPLGKHFYL